MTDGMNEPAATMHPVRAVILCGGEGARLWPASTPDRPKPFVALTDGRSGFQDALLRGGAVAPEAALLVVGAEAHRTLIRAQIGERPAELLLEPVGRNSGPAIAAAAVAAAREGDPVLVILSADHRVRDLDGFVESASRAIAAAREGAIVVFGVEPTEASTAYGYIKPGAAAATRVERFVEKPDDAAAEQYRAEGYLWNSGMFVARASVLLDAFEAFAPDVLRAVRRAVQEVSEDLLSGALAEAPSVAFDVAVMEKTDKARVVRAAFDWMDVGSWPAVLTAEADQDGSARQGDAAIWGAERVLARAGDGARVAVVGASDVSVIVEGRDVLVASHAVAQQVRSAAAYFAGRPRCYFTDLSEAAGWFDLWMHANALPLWSTLGRDPASGGFHESLDANGQPNPNAPRRLRVQARQVFVFATAGRLGWGGPWRETCEHGLAELTRRLDAETGLYRSFRGSAGQHSGAATYDQAFVLLAFAAAARAGIEPLAMAPAAEALVRALAARLDDDGLYRETEVPFEHANANMHLLEALLAWRDADGGWVGHVDRQAGAAMAVYWNPDRGVLFDTVGDRPDHRVWPGHQFEWASLIWHWRRDERASTLYEAGVRGVDPARGVVVAEITPEGAVVEGVARLWAQAERLRAAWRLGDAEGALATLNCLRDYCEAIPVGAWRDRRLPNGAYVSEAAPASSLYHLASAWAELQETPAPR